MTGFVPPYLSVRFDTRWLYWEVRIQSLLGRQSVAGVQVARVRKGNPLASVSQHKATSGVVSSPKDIAFLELPWTKWIGSAAYIPAWLHTDGMSWSRK